MRFKIVMAGRDCFQFVPRSLESVAAQIDQGFDVCVIDDASTDLQQPDFMDQFCRDHGWHFIRNKVHQGALYNHVAAVNTMSPETEDVIVSVDADDRLSRPDALSIVRSYYERYKPMLTYGSYASDPDDWRVMPAKHLPDEVIGCNSYRAFSARDDDDDPIWFNHLRRATGVRGATAAHSADQAAQLAGAMERVVGQVGVDYPDQRLVPHSDIDDLGNSLGYVAGRSAEHDPPTRHRMSTAQHREAPSARFVSRQVRDHTEVVKAGALQHVQCNAVRVTTFGCHKARDTLRTANSPVLLYNDDVRVQGSDGLRNRVGNACVVATAVNVEVSDAQLYMHRAQSPSPPISACWRLRSPCRG